MGLFDVIKSYVDRVRDSYAAHTPVDDFSGGDFDDFDDLSFGQSYQTYDTPDFGDIWRAYDEIEGALGDRIIDNLDFAGEGEYVTQFYDADSAGAYLENTPETVMRVYVEFLDEGMYEYHIYRYPSG